MTYLIICFGCLIAFTLGSDLGRGISSDVQKGWLSGTAKQMNATHAQYYGCVVSLIIDSTVLWNEIFLTGLPGLL
jgi:hypothetical protein